MPVIIPSGYCQVTIPIRHSAVTRPAAVTFGIDLATGVEPSDAVANAVLTAFTSHISLDSEVTLGPCQLRTVDTGGESLTFEGGVTHLGAYNTQSMPPNVAVLVKKSSLRGGRRGRGRMFIPFWAGVGDVGQEGNLDSAFLANCNMAVDQFLADLAAAGHEMVILHESEGNTPPGVPSKVTALQVDPRIATQRRRLR
jgi:hypothetical protein